MKDKNQREKFSSAIAVFFATLSSAVGLGNIVKFPAEVGQNGGSSFILIYLISVVLVSIPVMVAEFIIGRHSRKNAVQAVEQISGSKRWSSIGYLGVVSAILVLLFYSNIAGWVYSYAFKAIRGDFLNVSGSKESVIGNQFDDVVLGTIWPVMWQVIVVGTVSFILACGVKKGIERVSKIGMPILLFIILFCNFNTIRLDGFSEALSFLLMPDFSKVTGAVLLSALGLSFFKLAIGMCTMITYGSYFTDDSNLIGNAAKVAFSDLIVSILIGLVVFPVVFTFGLNPQAGIGLLFITIPLLFSEIPGGNLLIILFFLLGSIAATTAMVSMAEVVMAFVTEKFNLSRKLSALYIFIFFGMVGSLTVHPSVALGGLELAFAGGRNLFDTFDFVSSNILMPIGGLLIAIMLGHFVDAKIIKDQITNNGQNPERVKLYDTYIILLRYVTPLLVLVVFLTSAGIF